MGATVIIGGDVCPIGRNREPFRRGDADALLHDLRPEFAAADLRVVNLECPLIQGESPIAKIGPVLGAPVECVTGLKAIGADVVGLANNHIMDHGPGGLSSTIQVLEEYGIDYVGAGPDLESARRILIREIRGLRIGFLAAAEREFGIAARGRPGANPLDIIDLVRNIRSRRPDFDLLIVLLHGGSQFYPYPSPGLRETSRFLIEEGAAAVLCQHSHTPGCWERHREGLIVYGQGDFLFDQADCPGPSSAGVLVRLDLLGGGEMEPRLTPFIRPRDTGGVRRMPPEREKDFLVSFEERSRNILAQGFVESEFEKFCLSQHRYYLNALRGRPSLLRRVAGKLGLLYYLERPGLLRERLNLIRCESHREALIEVLSRGAGWSRGGRREAGKTQR